MSAPLHEHPDHEDETIGFLEQVSLAFMHMIGGTIQYLFRTVPQWIRQRYHDCVRLLKQLRDKLVQLFRTAFEYAIKVAVRSAKAAFFGIVWGSIVFGPGYLLVMMKWPTTFKVIGIAWTVLCIIGSIKALHRWRHHSGAGLAADLSTPRGLRMHITRTRVFQFVTIVGVVVLSIWIVRVCSALLTTRSV